MIVPAPMDVSDRQWCVILAGKMELWGVVYCLCPCLCVCLSKSKVLL